MNTSLSSTNTLLCALSAAALIATAPATATATGIGICGVSAQCGVTLINAAASAAGAAGGTYTSATGLVAGPSSGDGLLLPGSLAVGLTQGTLTATSGASTGEAAANLANGTLHAEANSLPFLTAGGIAESYDLLHWSVVGGGSALVNLSAHVDGIIAAGTGSFSDVYSLTLLSQGGGGDSPEMQFTGNNSGFGPSNSGGVSTTGWQSFGFSNQSASGFDFSGSFLVHNGETQAFFNELAVNCGSGAQCNFLNTASISVLRLPSGVSFTSDSGVFLTDTGSAGTGAVPEPGTLVLVASGAALAAGRLRRRPR